MIPPLLPPSTVLFVEKAVVFISRAFFCVFIEDFFKTSRKGYIYKQNGWVDKSYIHTHAFLHTSTENKNA